MAGSRHRHRRRLLLLKKMLILMKVITQQKRRVRRWNVHPNWENRKTEGDYHTLMVRMHAKNPTFFRNYTRMSPALFDKLEGLIGDDIKKCHPHQEVLSPGHRIAITLRFLASGDSFVSIAYAFRVGISTVRAVVLETCAKLWEILQPLYMPVPNEELWRKSAEEYGRVWHFPNCCGTADGKHVVMKEPNKSGTTFFNDNGTNSIILMVIVGPSYQFIAVDISAQGSQFDGDVFKASPIGRALDQNGLQLPEACKLPRSNMVVPHVLLGDEAFQLQKHFMTPFPRQQLDGDRRIFNYRLSRARRCTENAFGIMSARFRIFRRPIILNRANANLVIKAGIILHNFLMVEEAHLSTEHRAYCPPGYADFMDHTGSIVAGQYYAANLGSMLSAENQEAFRHGNSMQHGTTEAIRIRDAFKTYFISEQGQVPWQRNLPGANN